MGTTRSTIFTPSAYVKVVADRSVYNLGDTIWVAAEGTQAVPSWITTTWEYLPANVQIRDPSGTAVHGTSLEAYPPGSYYTTTYMAVYTIASAATTGEYVIWIHMTPGYGARFYVVEEKAMVDGSTFAVATITETETWIEAFSSTKVTVVDEFPISQLILGIGIVLSVLALKRHTKCKKSDH
jgi:hypothetical protein